MIRYEFLENHSLFESIPQGRFWYIFMVIWLEPSKSDQKSVRIDDHTLKTEGHLWRTYHIQAFEKWGDVKKFIKKHDKDIFAVAPLSIVPEAYKDYMRRVDSN